jgi:hypothetical protein
MKQPFLKQILLHFAWLIACLSLAGLATWLTALYMQHHPSGSAEGSGWGGMADALSMGVMFSIYLIMALVSWTILVFRQTPRIRNPFLYAAVHLLLLAIVVFFYIAIILQSW